VLSEVEAGAADALHPPAARFAEGDRPIPTKSGLRRRKAGSFVVSVAACLAACRDCSQLQERIANPLHAHNNKGESRIISGSPFELLT
jgi:hypothetical protein